MPGDSSPPSPDWSRLTDALEGIAKSLQGATPPTSVQLESLEEERDPFKTYDRLGRQQPQQFNWSTFFRNWPWLLEAFRPVPQQAVDYSAEAPVVDCPCEPARKVVVPAGLLVACEGCERSYFGLPTRVLVTYGDMEPPERPQAAD